MKESGPLGGVLRAHPLDPPIMGPDHKWLVFRKSKDLYLIITQKLIIHEIRRISPWNLVDFTWNLADFTMKSGGFQVKSSRFHLKSTQNLINSDVSAKTLQFGGVHGGGYDPRFHEIKGHSPSPAFIKLNSFCWNIWIYKVLGGFHLKSGGFHVKSKDLLQGIVTLCF